MGECYKRKNDMITAIHYWMEGFNFFPNRIENLFEIVTHYRQTQKYNLAYQFYVIAANERNKIKKLDYLFLKKEKVAAVITEGQEIANVPSKASRDYTLLVFKGFTLNFLNPGVIIYWFAILAKGFDLVEEYHNNIHIVFFIATILLTYFGIDCLKALGASRLKPLVTNKLLRGLNQLIGFIFFGTGVFLILRQFVL
jgi:hypothetical protein